MPGNTFMCDVGANGQQTTISGPQFSLTAFGGQHGGVGPGKRGGGQGAPIGLFKTSLPIINTAIMQPGTDGQPGSNISPLRPPLIAGTGDGGRGGNAFNRLSPIQGFAFMSIGGVGGREASNGFPGFGVGFGGGFFVDGFRGSNGIVAFFW